MNKLLIAAFLSAVSVSAFANNKFDTYYCEGRDVKLTLVLDWFGRGTQESVNGTYMGKKISYKPQENYRPSKYDSKRDYLYYKDPSSATYVRMAFPDLSGMPDMYYSGVIVIDGKTISIDCLNPAN